MALVAHVNLALYAAQQLRQGLVQRIQRDHTFDARMDVDIQAGIACQCEQQRFDWYFVHRDAIGLDFGASARRRQGCALLHRLGYRSGRTGRFSD
eukprot:gene21559-biopygen14678